MLKRITRLIVFAVAILILVYVLVMARNNFNATKSSAQATLAITQSP